MLFPVSAIFGTSATAAVHSATAAIHSLDLLNDAESGYASRYGAAVRPSGVGFQAQRRHAFERRPAHN